MFKKKSHWRLGTPASLIKGSLIVLISVLVIYGIVQAGSLTPSASPAATSYTATDIYNRLTTNTTATEGDHLFSPSGSPAGTLYTLTQVYSAIPTIDPVKVLVGTSYLGIAGTYNANLFNGSFGAGGFPGGSQDNGGVDDYNNAAPPPDDRYSKEWTQCAAGNNYCDTGDSGADAKDDSTGLIWSMPCNGSGCASFSDATPLTYSWDSSAVNNNARTASQLCSDHAGWSLPHQKQLMLAYIDGSYGNLEASGVVRFYWSATTRSEGTTYAWGTSLSRGGGTTNAKTSTAPYVRCVRLAP